MSNTVKPVATIIEDSCHASDPTNRAITVHVKYPRMVHAEVMTHRVFGRNGRSSRAVPVTKLLLEPIVEPAFYGANIPGMSAGEVLRGWRYLLARGTWLGMAQMTKLGVKVLHFAGLHKQWANRPLEWFGQIDVLITSNQWENFFALRLDEGAQPEIRLLAMAIYEAMCASTPRKLAPGEWHLPYVNADERATLSLEECKKLSVARSARITHKPFDGNDTLEAEMARYARLMLSMPVHASPAEHQLTPDRQIGLTGFQRWRDQKMNGCTPGWVQHRFEVAGHFIPG